jgi:RNA polymerase sigma-70 factor (ECF subfamily)
MGQTALALSELADCLPAAGGVEQAFDERALVRSIENFLHATPRLKREVFIRRYWYLSPIKQIADDYGMSPSKVASMLHRTRQQLKTHLREEGVTL